MRRRRFCATLALALALPLLAVAPAAAQFLPEGFFDNVPAPGAPAKVEADTLAYNPKTDVISAEGGVVMSYSGYVIHCEQLRYAQGTGELLCVGNAAIRDPAGTTYQSDRIEVTGGMKQAFLQSLTLTTTDGAMITARDVNYSSELKTILTEATYAPCGLCVDEKGHRIGWKVRAARFVQDASNNSITFEQPVLEILGIPVAWLPWLSMPDPSKPRNNGFLLPSVDYKAELGLRAKAPYFVAIGEDTNLLFTPTLMSRQGFLMGAEWQQQFDYGAFDLKAAGLYQLDPGAFAGTVGERDWRGAVQSTGHFQVAEHWTAGWSYTSFSDAAFLDDYGMDDSDWTVNEVYVTHLSDDYFADLRLQQFLVLGNFDQSDEDKQAIAVPNARADSYTDLGDMGQLHISSSLIGVSRDNDSSALYNGIIPYVFGFAGDKLHGTLEVSWQKQMILAGGLVATPFLGVRADATNYDAGDTLSPNEPSDSSLLVATPIAALDFRWPLMASNSAVTQLLEPIAQIVYRGSDTTDVGITNDNAHSFVLDDTNIFSYNRFTGTDRQETGLRANLGARYLANFEGGQWVELTAGESFHLAGVNGLAIGDEVNTGVSSGLGDDASYVVLGARGSPVEGVTLGAKLQVDPNDIRVARAGLGASYGQDDYSVGGDYVYLAADPATGVAEDQHEVTVRAGVPLPFDYWTANASLSWDLASNQFLKTTGEVLYDDGFFLAGAYAGLTGPTHTSPDEVSFGIKFKLKGPGTEVGF